MFAKMLLAAVAFFAAAGNPLFAGPQRDTQQDQQEAPSNPQSRTHTHSQDRVRPPIPEGPRLLISLNDGLNTKLDRPGKRFVATTLEALPTADGGFVPGGAQIRGHIDRVQSAGDMGRAQMWLAFDDIRTPRGWRPLVALLIDAPGIHSIHVAYDHEGEIQAASANRDQAMRAAAAGALVGVATGISSGTKEKEAAMAAASAAVQAFMISYGLGQEFTLDPGTKLEIVLQRPLSLGRT